MRCEYCNAEEAVVVIEECYHDGGTMGYSAVCHDCAARNLDEAARDEARYRASGCDEAFRYRGVFVMDGWKAENLPAVRALRRATHVRFEMLDRVGRR